MLFRGLGLDVLASFYRLPIPKLSVYRQRRTLHTYRGAFQARALCSLYPLREIDQLDRVNPLHAISKLSYVQMPPLI